MDEGKLNELPVPEFARNDGKAKELVRVWVASGNIHVSLATGIWDDPAAWGLLLVDLARHLGSSYEQSEGRNLNETLLRIKEGFDAEWQSPTDQPSGDLLE